MDDALPITRLAFLLFMLMGPIGLIPRFAGATAGQTEAERRAIALWAVGIAAVAILLAVFVGASAMGRVGTTPSSLIMAAGGILAVTALLNLLGATPAPAASTAQPASLPMRALTPIAIPGIVTPVGVAILIIFSVFFRSADDRLTILALTAAILAMNLLAMLGAQWFMRRIGMGPLLLLGSVFGVLQVALGVEIFMSGLLRSPIHAGS
ncbi:MarC family protein [Rubellimicrobium roseum]|uniref:UPF0056 membrane protein n=1 Tax=Rubellimicrobium roseum TaxID=687525 RepID=A0A5C4N8W7_9RHOB|nr:MarC family protein [Rubellimicrobium roseum]TNC65385.1 MarC family protein [Rubellimicrobium roseum]